VKTIRAPTRTARQHVDRASRSSLLARRPLERRRAALKQIRHLVGLLSPALDALARHAEPVVVDCGAGKAISARCLRLVLVPAGRGAARHAIGRAPS
jgi:hypothetical protein